MEKREHWKSRIGFIFAALGSAVGLGSIWRFPYVVGENGGAVFILMYLFCLLLIGFPVLLSEIAIGKAGQKDAYGAFFKLSKSLFFGKMGKMTILTGFIISSFYSVIAGWSLGYLIEAIFGKLSHLKQADQALSYFQGLSSDPYWTIGFHFLFLVLSIAVLMTGVRKGIELGSKIMMPLLFFVLLILVIKGLTMPSASKGLSFLFSPDFSQVTAGGFLVALGQAFFTLSLGQGTMVTYGSYLPKGDNVFKSCLPVVLLNTLIGLLMGVAIFTIVFSVSMEPNSGPALIFETLPLIFSELSFGWLISILFFTLVVIAALTSEISALEPMIAYLMDERKYSRHKAVILTGVGAFLLGVPSALSFGALKNTLIFGMTFYDVISSVSVNVLVPLGGFFAVLLVGWKWKGDKQEFLIGDKGEKHPILFRYFTICSRYIAPALIVLILLNILGIY